MDYLTALQWAGTAIDFLVALHVAALILVNATKTPKDNEILEKAYRYVEIAAGLIGRRSKL